MIPLGVFSQLSMLTEGMGDMFKQSDKPQELLANLVEKATPAAIVANGGPIAANLASATGVDAYAASSTPDLVGPAEGIVLV